MLIKKCLACAVAFFIYLSMNRVTIHTSYVKTLFFLLLSELLNHGKSTDPKTNIQIQSHYTEVAQGDVSNTQLIVNIKPIFSKKEIKEVEEILCNFLVQRLQYF